MHYDRNAAIIHFFFTGGKNVEIFPGSKEVDVRVSKTGVAPVTVAPSKQTFVFASSKKAEFCQKNTRDALLLNVHFHSSSTTTVVHISRVHMVNQNPRCIQETNPPHQRDNSHE